MPKLRRTAQSRPGKKQAKRIILGVIQGQEIDEVQLIQQLSQMFAPQVVRAAIDELKIEGKLEEA